MAVALLIGNRFGFLYTVELFIIEDNNNFAFVGRVLPDAAGKTRSMVSVMNYGKVNKPITGRHKKWSAA